MKWKTYSSYAGAVAVAAAIGFFARAYFNEGSTDIACYGPPVAERNVAGENSHEIVVMSQPPGAEIYIGGNSSGVFTPGKIRVASGEKIFLRKEGYLTHSQNLGEVRQGDSLNATLIRADVGYLSITASVADAEIFLNGVSLNAKSPVFRHPVPVGKRIKVKAVDRQTGKSTEKTVIVRANQNQEIFLNFNRSPSGTK